MLLTHIRTVIVSGWTLKMLVYILIVFFSTTLVHSYIEKPGPRFPPTKGEIWPKPKYQVKSDSYFILVPQLFEFKVTSNNECALLREAIVNYEYIISKGLVSLQNKQNSTSQKKPWLKDDNYLGVLETVNIYLDGECNGEAYPSENMTEAYSINISEREKQLNSTTVWGILRGIESFSQMVYIGDDYASLRVNKSYVEDQPRFAHRGLLLDTSRHFIPLNSILLTLEAMTYNKLNVFHWHIVDDQSFPYVSRRFPELSLQGAYVPYKTYSYSDIQTVIEYARLRGIRVIPEFDTPGHTRSWGVSHPELLTACEGSLAGAYGPIDPTKNYTYSFLKELFEEVSATFADRYIHLGGDEVEFECWHSNSNITKFMIDNGIENDYKALESLYIQKVINLVDNLNYKSIVWEEVFTNGVKLPSETIVQVWKDFWPVVMFEVTYAGMNAILSSCWYLDHLDNNGDWEKFYNCEPFIFSNNATQLDHVIGGEACMWSEVVNEYNVISRVWPRASATAEKLWSERDDVIDMYEVKRRLEEHVCRMNRRGIAAQPPNGPGFCL